MIGGHFYHGTVRKLVSAFGSLFANIKVVRLDAARDIESVVQVPIRHGPADPSIVMNDDAGDILSKSLGKRFREIYPRMTYEMTSMRYLSENNLNKFNSTAFVDESNPYRTSFVPPFVPYAFNFSLYVIGRNKTDCLQVVEQILPFFRPHLTMSLHHVARQGHSDDVRVSLLQVSEEDNYGDSDRGGRHVIYTLDFELKYGFYGPVRTDYESAVQKFATANPVEQLNPIYGPCRLPSDYSPDEGNVILKVIVDYYGSDEEVFNDSNFTDERVTITAEPSYARSHDKVQRYVIKKEEDPPPRPEDAS